MESGTFRKSEQRIENTKYGTDTYTYTAEIVIEEKNYYGTPRFYQTSRIWRNNVMVQNANSPADSDYSKTFRDWVMS